MVGGEPAGFAHRGDTGSSTASGPGMFEGLLRIVVDQLTRSDQVATYEVGTQLAQ
jgi:hypothetical protein